MFGDLCSIKVQENPNLTGPFSSRWDEERTDLLWVSHDLFVSISMATCDELAVLLNAVRPMGPDPCSRMEERLKKFKEWADKDGTLPMAAGLWEEPCP